MAERLNSASEIVNPLKWCHQEQPLSAKHYEALVAAHSPARQPIRSKPKQPPQHEANFTVGRSSPRITSTLQGVQGSSGVHSWHSGRQDDPLTPTPTVTVTTLRTPVKNAAAAMVAVATAAAAQQKQQNQNNNNNSNNNQNNVSQNPATKAQLKTQSPVVDALPGVHTPAKMKPRNRSEDAINDLLQRIPDIGSIFDVHSRIGNGTFSTVLLATLKREAQLPDNMRRKFAIKHHIPTSHPDRIMKELQCMTKMGGTDNVVGINCCLRCDASAAFIMPYMPHDRFHDFYTKMDVSEIRRYMRNLLIALRHVHRFNIIHRDVKPSNFLYNRRRREFLLVDFGLAQHVNAPLALPAQQQQQQQQQQQKQTSAVISGGLNNKRPREREAAGGNATQMAQVLQAAAAAAAVVPAAEGGGAALPVVGGVAKRMRLLEEAKMPLKPVNEIALSTKAVEALVLEDAKSVETVAETGAPSSTTTNNNNNNCNEGKYNTNRNAGAAGGGGLDYGKCYCFANPSVCLSCLMKKEVHASRAGTPGYRPPEVLLKYADQTTAVDIWAAGVIFLSILSSVYPFFKAPNDYIALAEIVTIFGDRAIRKTAVALERMVTLSQRSRPLNLRKLCLRFRHRAIFSDAQMVKKHEQANGVCPVCKNCDQYYFNCLCEESEYVTEPLEPYECFPPSAYDLLERLLEVNPHKRITAEEALNHPFFTASEEELINSMAAAAGAATGGKKRNSPKQALRKRTPKAATIAATAGDGANTNTNTNATEAGLKQTPPPYAVNFDHLQASLNKL